MTDDVKRGTEADAIAALAKRSVTPTVVERLGATWVVAPEGAELTDVTDRIASVQDAPRRVEATVDLASEAAFVAYVQKWSNPASTVFVDLRPGVDPIVEAILDYHGGSAIAPKPAWGTHRAVWRPKVRPEWRQWSEPRKFTQVELAHLIEDSIGFLTTPDAVPSSATELAAMLGYTYGAPADVLKASRGLELAANASVRHAVELATGSVSIAFVEEAKPVNVDVPGLFAVAVPVIDGDPTRYVLPIRLRYRRAERGLSWELAPHGADRIRDRVFGDLLERIQKAVTAWVFAGAAPKKGGR